MIELSDERRERLEEFLEIAEWRMLEFQGITDGNGVTVALVKLPFRDELCPAILLEPKTSRDQIYAAWGGHISKYRDRFYRQQHSPILFPQSFYKQLYKEFCERVADVKGEKVVVRKTTYADIAEGLNRHIESNLIAHIRYANKLPERQRDKYLDLAQSTVGALCKNKREVETKIQEALENVKGNVSFAEGVSLVTGKKLTYKVGKPINKIMVRYGVARGKKLAELEAKQRDNKEITDFTLYENWKKKTREIPKG